jgi:hypothetical protein
MVRHTRKNARHSAPAVLTRKPTVLGSHKLHQLCKRASDYKAIVAAVTAFVIGISALFISSKGGYLERWTSMRTALSSVPCGATLASFMQRAMDAFRRLIGWGINVGDVVEPLDKDNVMIGKGEFGEEQPNDDVKYEEVEKLVVAQIDAGERTFNAIKLKNEHDGKNREAIMKIIQKANKQKKSVDDSLLIRNEDYEIAKDSRNPFDFKLDDFKKCNKKEQFKSK